MTVERIHHLSETIYKRLIESPSFSEYESAFRSATGLPMRLVVADPNTFALNEHRDNQSQFCEMINPCGERACDACIKVNQDLMQKSSIKGPTSCNCFAGLKATSIPVYAGTMVVGYLKTGQVFHRTPTEEDFEAALTKISESRSFTDVQIEGLRKAYFETEAISPERYQSMVTLLEHFARELSTQSEKLAIAANEQEPAPISRARKHIHAQLDEAISLPQVARIAGMSESHFCRQFKMATGMTLTEYVNYTRILWAKSELLKPSARISEIAFQVGFQSLSQFNRCFAKFHGGSPSQYRDEASANPAKAAS
ncbi:helix-turn-helix domain-containing protein [Verrucomicrobiaceae bacterium N1E253]|uniref:Helix-turn-helix domain-containing protein n=1 Tax=Oceaniferula marina TaxID=2748318 RepID=A0A851GLL2_9BACT|nr:helix-turn-helix domain-containing protein [Oceaniferula marina]NWK56721.1 helix-turn-helix domain-containing protein [Oceaniferula marina]